MKAKVIGVKSPKTKKTTTTKKKITTTKSKKTKSTTTKVGYVRTTDLREKQVPINKKKNKNNKKILKFIAKFFLLICLIIGATYIYKYSVAYLYANERFFIDSIEITGCQNVTESEIKQLIPFQIGDSLVKIDLSSSEKELKEYKPELKNVSMNRKWKEKKVLVALQERLPEVFIYDNDENKIGLDFDNKPFNLRGDMSTMKVPILLCNNEQERANLLSFFKKIKFYLSDLVPEMENIKYGEVEDIILIMKDKTKIYWGLPKDNKIKEKSEKMLSILKDLSKKYDSIDYIDLSFLDNNKDKVIVKPSIVINEKNV